MATKIVTADDMQSQVPELLSFISEGNDILIEKDKKTLCKINTDLRFRKKKNCGAEQR